MVMGMTVAMAMVVNHIDDKKNRNRYNNTPTANYDYHRM